MRSSCSGQSWALGPREAPLPGPPSCLPSKWRPGSVSSYGSWGWQVGAGLVISKAASALGRGAGLWDVPWSLSWNLIPFGASLSSLFCFCFSRSDVLGTWTRILALWLLWPWTPALWETLTWGSLSEVQRGLWNRARGERTAQSVAAGEASFSSGTPRHLLSLHGQLVEVGADLKQN